jgi:hypothetical protein
MPSLKLHCFSAFTEIYLHKVAEANAALSLYSEGPSTCRLPLLLLCFRPRSPQYLQEVCRPPPHPRMDICLTGLDVVVKVVTESLDV